MKITALLGLSLLISSTTFAQFESSKQVYKAPAFKDSLEKHKVVAILPFKATIAYKRMPKGFNLEGNNLEEKKLGLNMQQGMYTYLLRKGGKYTVTFQDIERTNILLKQAGIFDNLDMILPDSLAKILKMLS